VSIDVEVDSEGIALITINRPERLNAMDAEHYQGLSNAWMRVRDDGAIRVAIVTGAGEKSFTTGADLKSRFAGEPQLQEVWLTQREQLLNRGLEVWKPIIAAINGYCLGGGMTLMLATDIRLAAPHATFGLTEVKRGLIPANGGTQRISRQLPWPIAMELLLVGDSWNAETAARWGLINAVVPASELIAKAYEIARKIAANGPLAVQAAKELATRSRDLDIATGLRMEAAITHILRSSEDAKEGPKAFAEKRAPVFQGK
jgi:E-phenylitaconyl-CoA hydratase